MALRKAILKLQLDPFTSQGLVRNDLRRPVGVRPNRLARQARLALKRPHSSCLQSDPLLVDKRDSIDWSWTHSGTGRREQGFRHGNWLT